MQIVYKHLNEIKPYENNPRINDGAVEAVMKSISEFGFKIPIIIDNNNIIIAGHTRYKAAKGLNIQSVPCITADDMTPEQVKAFRIIDNKTTEFSDWDFEKLKQEFSEIDFDFSQFGFENLTEAVREELDNTSQELSVDDYSDEQFECECPRCGFKFNR